MQAFINFCASYYIVFIVIGVVLIFALIGYLIDAKNTVIEDRPETIKLESIEEQSPTSSEPTKETTENVNESTTQDNSTTPNEEEQQPPKEKLDEVETLGETIEIPKVTNEQKQEVINEVKNNESL